MTKHGRAGVVVGADGGNSKTDVVLATTEGQVLSRLRLPGTRPHRNGGFDVLAEQLAARVRTALDEHGRAGVQPESAVFCLANVDLPEDETATRAALEDLGVARQVEVRNDTFAVLFAGTERGWGVALVAGAGINALGVHPDGRTHRFLAMGEYTGDWGGGRSVGAAAVGAAIRAQDGRGAPTTLTELVPVVFGRPDARTVAVDVHRGRLAARDLLSATPVVLTAAADGDEVAGRIVDRLADELAEFSDAALTGLGLTDRAVDVVLGGGILQAGNDRLLDRLGQRLLDIAPAARLIVLDVAPVAGAVAEAMRLAGAGPAAIARARRQFVASEAI